MAKPKLNNQDTFNENRKPYQKPQIERVKLVPDESVLGICKAGGAASGPSTTNCINPIGGGFCKDQT